MAGQGLDRRIVINSCRRYLDIVLFVDEPHITAQGTPRFLAPGNVMRLGIVHENTRMNSNCGGVCHEARLASRQRR